MNTVALRVCGGTVLGALFGLLGFYILTHISPLSPLLNENITFSFSNLLMWEVLTNRIAIGFVIGLMGFITVHPLFRFPLPAWLRGFVIGSFISLTLSFSLAVSYEADQVTTFWIITIAGGIIGLITDVFLTTTVGEGTDLQN